MKNKSLNTPLVFMLGAATGGIAALLLAPTSGRELRERIGEDTEKLRLATTEKAREARDKMTEKYRDTAQQGRELVASAKENTDAYREAVKGAVKEGKAAYDRELAKTH